MRTLTLAKVQTIIVRALESARELELKSLCVAVLYARGAMEAFAAKEDTSLQRGEIAHGKAYGSLARGLGSRGIHRRAEEQACFIASVTHAAGASGDVSHTDEAVAPAGIEAAGLTGD